ncbi:MAG: C4-type zinc ribbon domain-containing protein [Candidatus Euphemobacter frigidus]|nr:C4-type zinc ribbon domain-containing protein [Candidatus Euphemobacter frigidus]MDP8275859.1 C4-type zinc ribbon domain-containing protein [Candidatus Euphemobacter frigidus]
MREEIKQLLRLQDLDIEIRNLEENRMETERSLEIMRKEIADDEKSLEEEQGRLKTSKLKNKELELQVADKKNYIEKYQQQLFKVKNNKEYAALLHEIKGREADISALEDQMLEFMEEVENEQQKLDVIGSDLESVRERYREKKQEVQTALERIGGEIVVKKGERSGIAAELDPGLCEMYEIIFARKPDRAVVAVVNNACEGCNMELTAQVLNDLERDERVHRCENCGRFVYLPPAE